MNTKKKKKRREKTKQKSDVQQAKVSYKARDDSACQQPILHHYHVSKRADKTKTKIMCSEASGNGKKEEKTPTK